MTRKKTAHGAHTAELERYPDRSNAVLRLFGPDSGSTLTVYVIPLAIPAQALQDVAEAAASRAMVAEGVRPQPGTVWRQFGADGGCRRWRIAVEPVHGARKGAA